MTQRLALSTLTTKELIESKSAVSELKFDEKEILAEMPTMLRTELQNFRELKEKIVLLLSSLKMEKSDKNKEKIQKEYTNDLEQCRVVKEKLRSICRNIGKQGDILLNQEKLNEALKCFQSIMVVYKELFGIDSYQYAATLGNMGNIYYKRGEYEAAILCTKKILLAAEKQHGYKSDSVATALNNLGNILSGQGKYTEAHEHYLKANNIVQLLHGDNGIEITLTLNNIANLLPQLDQHEEAIKIYRQILGIQIKVLGNDNEKIAMTLNGIGVILRDQDKYSEALDHHRQALAIYKKLFKEAHSLLAVTHNNIGMVLFKQGEHKEALFHHEKAAIISKKTNQIIFAETQHALGNVHFELANFSQALICYEEAKNIRENIFGEHSHEAAETLSNIANIYAKQDKYELAIKIYEKVIIIKITIFGEYSSHVISYYFNIGNTFLVNNQHAKALHYFNKGLDAARKISDKNNSNVAKGLCCLGNYYAKLNQHSEAFKYFNAALVCYREIFGENNAHISAILNNIGLLLREQGQYEEAMKYLQQAIKIDESIFGENNAHLVMPLINIGHIFANQGKTQEALSYYNRSLTIACQFYGENSSHVATLWNDIGNIFSAHGLSDLVISHYQKALTLFRKIFGDNSVQVATVLGAIGLVFAEQGHYEKGNEHQLQARKLFQEILGEESEEVATVYNNSATIYMKQQQYEKALDFYQLSYEIRKKNLGVNCYKTCNVQMLMMRVHIKFADTLDEKHAASHYQKAENIGKLLLKINEEILASRNKKFSDYDMIGHNKLLRLLAKAYTRQGKIDKIGELYYTQTKHFSHSPILILYYSKQAIKYLSLFSTHQHQLMELYSLRALIGHQHKRYNFALSNLRKIAAIDAKAETYQKQLKQLQLDQSQEFCDFDEDLSTQIEHCRNNYDEIRLLILEELETDNPLFASIRNRFAELIININNILDIAYGRFIRGMIYQANKTEDQHDLYFPLTGSENALQNELKRNQIIIDPYEFTADIFKEIKKPQGISIRKTLIQHGYLGQDGYVKDTILHDKTLKKLDVQFDCIRKELTELLLQVGVGKRLSIKNLKKLNEKIRLELEYFPPDSKNIITALDKSKVITTIMRNSASSQTYKLQQEFKLSPGTLVKVSGDDPIEQKRFAHYEHQIIDIMRKVVQVRREQKSLDKDFPTIYSLIEQEQPFYYCTEAANKTSPGMWQQSWLDKVVAISNGGKHIGLMPHALSDNLAEQIGTLKRNKLRIMIHYVEPIFYSWTFASVIQSTAPMSDAELMQTSAEIFQILKNKNYISKGVIIHPLATKYLDAAKTPNNTYKRMELENIFFCELQKDLPKRLKCHANAVGVLMLRRVLQLSHIELHFDNQVEFDGLIQRSLVAMDKMVATFGKTRRLAEKKQSFEKKQSDFVMPEEKNDFATLEKQQDEFLELVSQPKSAKISDWIKYHHWVVCLGKLYYINNKTDKAGVHYVQAAKVVLIVYPALAIHYYRKAIQYYSCNTRQQESLKQACLDISEQYAKNGLWNLAVQCLSQHSQYLTGDHKKDLKSRQKQYEKLSRETFINYPTDIYFQIEHAKDKFLRFQYLLFQLSSDPDNLQLKQKIQHLISEIIIKLRHLLDQAFMRLVHQKIYLPNNKWSAINIKNAIKFYAFNSKKDLLAELRKKEIISDEKDKVSLDRDFPEIFDLLMQAQSFTTETWLRELIDLSNQVKHVGFNCLTVTDSVGHFKKIEILLNKSLIESDKIFAAIFKMMPATIQDNKQSNERNQTSDGVQESKTDSQNAHRMFAYVGLSDQVGAISVEQFATGHEKKREGVSLA